MSIIDADDGPGRSVTNPVFGKTDEILQYCNTLPSKDLCGFTLSFIHSFPLNIQPEGSGASNELLVDGSSGLNAYGLHCSRMKGKKMFYTPVLFGTFDVCTYHSQ